MLCLYRICFQCRARPVLIRGAAAVAAVRGRSVVPIRLKSGVPVFKASRRMRATSTLNLTPPFRGAYPKISAFKLAMW